MVTEQSAIGILYYYKFDLVYRILDGFLSEAASATCTGAIFF